MSLSSGRGKEKHTVLVLGATGLVGGAVARALLSFPWFQVFIGTRRPWCSEAMLLQRAGARVLEVDFNYKQSLLEAMTGVKCVFLHTHYWEMYSRTLEVCHGQSVVEAAVAANVEHIVYDGTNYVKPSEGRMCGYLTSRLDIEEIIIRSGISYTIVVFPFVLENLLTVFRPFEVSANLYALLALPMESNLLPVGGLNDMAICVCKIILQLRNVRRAKVFLATEMVTVSQIAAALSSVIQEKRFFDPELSVEDFMAFEFPGAKDLATMFLHYQNDAMVPDLLLTKSLNPRLRKMAEWMEENRSQILRVLSEPKEASSVETFLSATEASRSCYSQTFSFNVSNSAAVSVCAMSFLKTRRSLGNASEPSTSPSSPLCDAVSPRRTGASVKTRRFISVSDSNLNESGPLSLNPSCSKDLTWLRSDVNFVGSDCNQLDSTQFDTPSPSGVASTSLPSSLSLVSFEREEPWTDESQQRTL